MMMPVIDSLLLGNKVKLHIIFSPDEKIVVYDGILLISSTAFRLPQKYLCQQTRPDASDANLLL
jgi:hypothetical protein